MYIVFIDATLKQYKAPGERMKKFRQTCHKSFFSKRSSLLRVASSHPLIGGEEECNLHTFDCFVRPDRRKKSQRWRLKMGRSRLCSSSRRRGHTPLQARFVRAHLRACVVRGGEGKTPKMHLHRPEARPMEDGCSWVEDGHTTPQRGKTSSNFPL